MRKRRRRFDFARSLGTIAALCLLTDSIASGHRQSTKPADQVHTLLRTIGAFTSDELTRLDRGEPVAKVLDTDRREVAIVGAVRVAGPQTRLFDRYRNPSSVKVSDLVLEAGRFSTPPVASDLRDLHVEAFDLDQIRACKPGDCGVRLAAGEIDRFAHEVNWNSPNWQQQAGDLWRTVLAAHAAAYIATGALGDYRNKATPLEVADEFRILFGTFAEFEKLSPEFFDHLKRFPAARLDGAEDLLYWSKEDINRPVTRITHLSLYPAPPDARRPGLIATKQIYAAHYFDAGIGCIAAFDDGASGFYVVSMNRVRTRSLTGMSRTLVRSMVQRRSRDSMQATLQSTKTSIER